ncbi:hypothetical protein CMI37_10105 [Candidatus Pacearchaeota archaeon]|nr:hypothetical protein [Candidatus Pacearchaeota archaeon]
MAQASPAFTAFTAGEFSPRLHGRTDLAKYSSAAEEIENFIVHPHGGLTRRPGTEYIGEVKDSSAITRLVPFEFSTTQAYVLEFGNLYMRVYKDGGRVVDANVTVSGATKANPAVITATSHGYSDDDHVVISSVAGMTQINDRTFKIANKTTNTFELSGVDSRDYSTYSSGGVANVVYEIATPYTSAQLRALKFAQSADIMYVCHPSVSTRKLTRTGHTAWTLTEVVFGNGPFLASNVTTTTITPDARSGSGVTLTASTSTFASTDVGRQVKIFNGYLTITGYSSATAVTATVGTMPDGSVEILPTYTAATVSFHEGDPDATGLEHNDRLHDTARNFVDQGFTTNMVVTISGSTSNNKSVKIVQVTDDTMLLKPADDLVAEAAGDTVTIVGTLGATADWALGYWSTTDGFPGSVSFYEERLVFAGSTNYPQTLWFSSAGDYENFTGAEVDGAVLDTNALTYTIASNQVNVIRYLSATRSLLVGTVGGEFAVRASGTDQPLTPTNAQIKRQCSYGSADVRPEQVANVTLFLHRNGRKLQELLFDFDSDSYKAPDLTILSEHITENGIVEMAYQKEPDSILWCVRDDGVLAAMTYRRDEDVVAWHRHKIGGKFTKSGTDYTYGHVESIASIPGTASEDELWVIVARTVDVPLLLSAGADTTNDRVNSANHGLSTGTAITFTTNGVVPTGAQKGDSSNTFKADGETVYYARNVSTNVFSIFIDSAGAAADTEAKKIGFSTAGTGTMSVYAETRTTATKRFVERFKSFDFGTDVADAFFVDSGLTYSGSAASTLTGTEHLRGFDVEMLADGATHPTRHPGADPSQIVLDRTTTKCHIGLPFTSHLLTLRADIGSQEGTSQGKTKRISDVTVRLFRTVGLLVGESATVNDRVPFRDSSMAMDTAVPLFTGDKDVEFDGGYGHEGQVYIAQDQALPMTIVGVYPRLQTFDR